MKSFVLVLLLALKLISESHQSKLSFSRECSVQSLIEPCTCRAHYKELIPSINCIAISVDSLAEVLAKLKQNNITWPNLRIAGIHFSNHTFPAGLFDKLAIHNCFYINNEAFPEQRLVGIEDGAFAGLEKSTNIDLSENNLTQIPGAVRNFSAQKWLDLSQNLIEAIHENSFEGLNSLVYLSLYSNSIKTLAGNVFAKLQSLGKLNLGSNQISTISDAAFAGLYENLDELLLFGNELREVPTVALGNFTKLTVLRLNSNQIGPTIRRDTFAGDYVRTLTQLMLNENRIETIENGAFDNLDAIDSLTLNGNRLKHIGAPLFSEAMLNRFSWLPIDENPLECSCKLSWFPRWIERRWPNETEAPSWRIVKCVMPGAGTNASEKIRLRDIGKHIQCPAA